MSRPDRFEQTDKDALHMALLALKQCPRCRRALRPAQTKHPDEWGCVSCDRGWNRQTGAEIK